MLFETINIYFDRGMDMRKLRVLHVIPWFIGYGIERFIVDLVSGLDKKRFEIGLVIVGVYDQSALKQELDNANIRIFHLDRPISPYVTTKKLAIDEYTKSWRILLTERKSIIAVSRVCREFKPDIVHTHFLGLIPAFLPAVFNRNIIRVHTVHADGNVETRNLGAVGRYALEKHKFLPVSISEFSSNSLKEALDIKEIKVIRNGINTQRFTPASLERNSGCVTIINVSRFSEEKRHALLMRAFEKVCRECDNVRLVLVGEGHLQKYIEEIAEVCGIADKVEFTGRRGDIQELLAMSDIYAMTSKKEAFGLSTVEAMACGLPVVAMNSGSAPELVKDGINGFLVGDAKPSKMAEAIIRLVKDRNLRRTMSGNSRDFAVKLDIRNMVESYENYYTDLYSRHLKEAL